jgi:hypothetical protein
MAQREKVAVQNVNVPGHTAQVDAVKYKAMRDLLLEIVPLTAPGLTAKEMLEKLQPLLPQELWPGGEKSGWWQKTVQLDLEAKGLLVRDSKAKPMRWYRAA